MVRLGFGYLAVSFVAPILGLLAYSGGDTFVTGLMALPLVVTTFAFLWLVVEIARRDDLLSHKQFLKVSLVAGISSLLLVAASTELVSLFAPSINLGVPLADFRMFYFVYAFVLPTILYSAAVGSVFWHIAVRGNPYVRAEASAGGGSRWYRLPRAGKLPAPVETAPKKAA
jgi:hypothetical protein